MIKIQVLKMGSKSEVLEFLHKTCVEKHFIGEQSQVINCACVYCVYSEDRLFCVVGLAAENHGIDPKCIIAGDSIILGYNKDISIIRGKTEQRISTSSVFYDFLIPQKSNVIIAIFELDVICFSIEGQIFWKYSAHDIITNFYICDDILRIETEICSESICTSTGAIL